MPTDQILSLLITERDKLNRAIEVLQDTPRTAMQPEGATPATDTTPAPNHAPKRVWTPSMRLAAKRRAKAVWVRRRKAEAKKG